MKEFSIYLIGGMSKFGKEDFCKANNWREFFKEYLEKTNKVKVCNPNDYYNFLDNKRYDSEIEIMKFDLYKLKNSDLCICNFNDTKSLGSMAELAIAYDKRKPILGLCENDEIEQLHPWQICMVDKMFTNKEDLADYLIEFYLN